VKPVTKYEEMLLLNTSNSILEQTIQLVFLSILNHPRELVMPVFAVVRM
jgi:hypothetical protein